MADRTDYIEIELELDEDTLFYLNSMAERYNITIDELVNRILKNYVDTYEKQSGVVIV